MQSHSTDLISLFPIEFCHLMLNNAHRHWPDRLTRHCPEIDPLHSNLCSLVPPPFPFTHQTALICFTLCRLLIFIKVQVNPMLINPVWYALYPLLISSLRSGQWCWSLCSISNSWPCFVMTLIPILLLLIFVFLEESFTVFSCSIQYLNVTIFQNLFLLFLHTFGGLVHSHCFEYQLNAPDFQM